VLSGGIVLSSDRVPRDIIDTYLEQLLSLQYKASDWISHPGTKGSLREKFLWQIIKGEFPSLLLENGDVEQKRGSHRQLDLIWIKSTARVGQLSYYDIEDCKLIVEIKSVAKKSEMDALNQSLSIYRAMQNVCPNLQVGMFCYSTNAQKKTVLSKLGFDYDVELDAYSGYNNDTDIYPHVNFLFSLDLNDAEPRPYFVFRDNNGGNVLMQESPAITHFLRLFQQEI